MSQRRCGMDDQRLLAPDSSGEVVVHLAWCHACQRRRAEYDRIEAAFVALHPRQAPAGWQARVLARIESRHAARGRVVDLHPEGPRGLAIANSEAAPARVQRLALLVAAAGAALLVFALAGGARAMGRPLTLWTATSIGAAVIATAVAWLALTRGRSMLGRPAAVLGGAAIAAPLLLLAWKVAVSASFADAMTRWPDRPGFRCLILSLAFGAAPLAAFLRVRRPDTSAAPKLNGVALGVAAGALSWTLIDLWCPVGEIRHLLLGHVLPIVALGAAGAVVAALVASLGTPASRDAGLRHG